MLRNLLNSMQSVIGRAAFQPSSYISLPPRLCPHKTFVFITGEGCG